MWNILFMILHYFDNKKSGPIVLFIHGTASANEIWDKQYKLLDKNNYRVIGIDLRGHGRSTNPGGECNLEEHLNDLTETLKYINLHQTITIVGHSFGAVLAVEFAKRFPNKVNRLLLISMPAKVPNLLNRYYKWLLGKPLELIKKQAKLLLRLPLKQHIKLAIKSDPTVVRSIWKASLKWDFISKVPEVSCPVFFSVGRFDYIALKSTVERLHKKLPNSTYKIFNWASHNCIEDSPKELNRWILASLP